MENQPNQPQKGGNKALWIVLAIVILAVIGYGVYAYVSNNANNANNANTASNVNQTVNNNTAANANSAANTNSNINSVVNGDTNTNSTTNTNIDTSGWTLYNNIKYGYSIKYPESCNYQESTTSGGLLLTTWNNCGMDVLVDQLNNKTVQTWAQERNYEIVKTYSVNQLLFTIASFTGEMAGTRSLALIPHGTYMFRIDITENNIEKLEAILATITFTE